MTVVQHKRLYKKDSKGKLRVWWVETDEDQYRVVSGLLDGKLVESDWKTANPKNVGRSNATTGPEQALSETQSLYNKQQNQGKYTDDVDKVDEVKDKGYFEPMLAEKWKEEKTKRGEKVVTYPGRDSAEQALAAGIKVFVQPKFDGIRNISIRSEDVAPYSVAFFSRDGQPRISCPHIQSALGSFHGTFDVVLDGELYNHDFHDDFNSIQSLILQRKPKPEDLAESEKYAQYHVYDVFVKDHPEWLFSERYGWLKENWSCGISSGTSVQQVQTEQVSSLDEIDEWYGKFLEQNYEGMIVRIDGPYENKRTKKLIKRKEFFDEEYEIVDIIEGQGNWNGKAKAVRFKSNAGDDRKFDDLPKASIKGTEAQLAELLRDRGDYLNNGSTVTVRFPNKTPGGDPRFGVAVAFWKGGRHD